VKSLRACSALLALGVLLTACSGSGDPTPPAASPTAGAGTERIGVAKPVGIVSGAGAIWVAAADGDGVWRVDPVTRKVTAKVEVGDTPLRVAFDGKLVWATVFSADRVVAIDPASNRVVTTVALTGEPEGVAFGFDSIWVVRQAARTLSRVGPDGKVLSDFPLGDEPRLVAVSDRYVFAANFGAGTVTRLDPASARLTTSQQLCAGAQGIATTADTVWVTCTGAGKLLAVDPETLLVIGSLDLGGEPDAVRVVDGAVWVAQAEGPTLVRIGGSPAQPTVAASLPIGKLPGLRDRANVEFVIEDGRFWVTAPLGNAVYSGAMG
jgi:YVTN family beta-propeller protein